LVGAMQRIESVYEVYRVLPGARARAG